MNRDRRGEEIFTEIWESVKMHASNKWIRQKITASYGEEIEPQHLVDWVSLSAIESLSYPVHPVNEYVMI